MAAALALLAWGAAPASAGGPTSVLIVSPESAQTASLSSMDQEYGELERLLGTSVRGTRDEPAEAGLVSGRQINVTWLTLDVSPWRVDRVFPSGEGREVWIHTAMKLPTAVDGHWHRAGHPDRLRALLKKLGVMGRTLGAGTTGRYPVPWETSGAPADSGDGTGSGTGTAPVAGASSAAGGGTDWWWALPGAGAGAALALALRPLAGRVPRLRRERTRGPRQELIDR
ncbi:hypothetical protein [Streptomyces fumanus]|uniref:hypothetical protein n=1 Tax=Streptomyces fumanus TaxID=67302 RepID=UPI0033E457F5